MSTQTQKFDYKGLVAEAKSLGLETTGKAPVIAARIEEFKASQAATVETKTERRGRPVNPNSARQVRLSQTNVGHRGRPADPNSAWNKRQAELKAKREAGELKLGRAINPNSARQQRLALKGTLPLGRPKKVETTVPTAEVPVQAEGTAAE